MASSLDVFRDLYSIRTDVQISTQRRRPKVLFTYHPILKPNNMPKGNLTKNRTFEKIALCCAKYADSIPVVSILLFHNLLRVHLISVASLLQIM